jgi:hypothetical protein
MTKNERIIKLVQDRTKVLTDSKDNARKYLLYTFPEIWDSDGNLKN